MCPLRSESGVGDGEGEGCFIPMESSPSCDVTNGSFGWAGGHVPGTEARGQAVMGSSLSCSLRNASGLTAADLAHAQGFQECAQLLSNAQNQLNQLNGFCHNGAVNGGSLHAPARSLFNGAPSRKRSLDCMESNHIKKARTDGLDSPMNMFSGAEGELESMNMEPAPVMPGSGGSGPFPFSPNGTESPQDQTAAENGSPAPKELEIFTVASMQIPKMMLIIQNGDIPFVSRMFGNRGRGADFFCCR
ncbi:hypothetical protein JZ751_006154 [Albula glossodonta]|uniref:Uncharacterized protein n=1 Tax=Albula glossodonta TaxID=121402 RepID=A0A8T2N471_9TELE|nr:hypothetical protein JZ751_006154 [Albula glossodonta]